jgi:hypothetical protein
MLQLDNLGILPDAAKKDTVLKDEKLPPNHHYLQIFHALTQYTSSQRQGSSSVIPEMLKRFADGKANFSSISQPPIHQCQ